MQFKNQQINIQKPNHFQDTNGQRLSEGVSSNLIDLESLKTSNSLNFIAHKIRESNYFQAQNLNQFIFPEVA